MAAFYVLNLQHRRIFLSAFYILNLHQLASQGVVGVRPLPAHNPQALRLITMLAAAALLLTAPTSALVLNGPRPLPALTRNGATRTLPLQRSTMTPRSPGGTMTLALPACSNAGFPMVAAAGGCTAIGLQLGLQALFDRSSDPIFSKAAGVTAHSVIA